MAGLTRLQRVERVGAVGFNARVCYNAFGGDNKLVVFAGAGASVDKPTSLPNFVNLAKEIAEDTGKTLTSPKEH